MFKISKYNQKNNNINLILIYAVRKESKQNNSSKIIGKKIKRSFTKK